MVLSFSVGIERYSFGIELRFDTCDHPRSDHDSHRQRLQFQEAIAIVKGIFLSLEKNLVKLQAADKHLKAKSKPKPEPVDASLPVQVN